MSIELPKDAEGREIPLDTVALFNRVGNVYSIVRWTCPKCGVAIVDD